MSIKLILYLFDLVCLVPDGDKMWVLATSTNNKTIVPPEPHKPKLFNLSGQLKRGDLEKGSYPFSFWDASGYQIEINSGKQGIEIQNTRGKNQNLPKDKNDYGINWMVNFNDLCSKKNLRIKDQAFGFDNAALDLVSSRLLIEKGEFSVTRFSRFFEIGSKHARKLGTTYFINEKNIRNENFGERSIANIIQVEIEINSPEVVFTKTKINNPDEKQEIVFTKWGGSNYIHLAYGNMAFPSSLTSGKHFLYHFRLLDNWVGDPCFPVQGTSYTLRFLRYGRLPFRLRVFGRKGSKSARDINAAIIRLMEPAAKCEPPMGNR